MSKMLKKLILISVVLLVCIVLMAVSLLIDAETFGQISSYLSIACVVLSVIGVIIMLRSQKKLKK
ncbi:MAG: hypothetical protein Q4A12_07090 [Eubacteriales bacterium]|nr:hypothetical protein [Eubacteriales bacterium]